MTRREMNFFTSDAPLPGEPYSVRQIHPVRGIMLPGEMKGLMNKVAQHSAKPGLIVDSPVSRQIT